MPEKLHQCRTCPWRKGNIGLRIAALSGRVPLPVVDGEQHERFADTLPHQEMANG